MLCPVLAPFNLGSRVGQLVTVSPVCPTEKVSRSSLVSRSQSLRLLVMARGRGGQLRRAADVLLLPYVTAGRRLNTLHRNRNRGESKPRKRTSIPADREIRQRLARSRGGVTDPGSVGCLTVGALRTRSLKEEGLARPPLTATLCLLWEKRWMHGDVEAGRLKDEKEGESTCCGRWRTPSHEEWN